MSDIEFASGFYAKAPHPNSPNFVKAKVSIKREEFIKWLQDRDGEYVNLDVKVSQSGNWYASVDNWKPDPSRASSGEREGKGDALLNEQRRDPRTDLDDDVPF